MGTRHALSAAAAAGFALVVLLPVAYFAWRALSASDGGAGSAVWSTLGETATWRAVVFTAGQALCSAALALVLGLPGAYILARHTFPLKRLVRAVTLVPFVLPSIIVVIAMVSFWGRSGLVGRLTGGGGDLVYSFAGIVAAHVFYNVSLVLRVVGEGWESLDPRLGQTAASLGQGRAGVFLRVTLPLLGPHLATAFFLVYLYCFLSFGVVLVFGGTRWATLEVLIYRAMYVRLNLGSAMGYAAIQLCLSLGFLALTNRWIGRFQLSRAATYGGARSARALGFWARGALGLYGLIALVFLVGPLVTLIGRAASPGSLAALFVPAAGAPNVRGILRAGVGQVVAGSLILAMAAGTLAFVPALGAALIQGRRQAGWRDLAFGVPLGLSVVTVALGADLLATDLWGRWVHRGLLVCVVQAVVAFPIVYRMVRGAVASLPSTYADAAASLGAGRYRRLLHVQAPLLRTGLLNGYAYAIAITLADFTVVMTVGRGDVVTLPVAIYRLIGFRSFDLGLALGLVYLALCGLVFLLMDATDPRAARRA